MYQYNHVINTSLISLNLSFSLHDCIDTKYRFKTKDKQNYPIKKFFETLKINSTLTDLNLYYNYLYDDTFNFLCDFLEKNTSIVNLNIRESNSLKQEDDINKLCKALKNNNTLTKITFTIYHDNYSYLYESLSDVLSTNTTLTDLNFNIY